MKYDVVIIGAGTGGTVAAKIAAKSGLNVCLIDGKQKLEIGNKICGNAISHNDFKISEVALPKGNELNNYMYGVTLYSPDLNSTYNLWSKDQQGFIVNRLKFGQRLLNEALDAGANFYDETRGINALKKNDTVVGVNVKKKHNKQSVYGQIIIDASGFHSKIRKNFKSSYIENYILNRDIIVCYREIILLNSPIQDPHFLRIYLSNKTTGGGYLWCFPENENTVNLGVGVRLNLNYNVKSVYKNVAFPLIKNYGIKKIINAGGGFVPVRRPIWSLVENGIMFVGDAGCMTNPLFGAGIGSSMLSGKYAAETAIKAIEKNNVSIDSLWNYNRKYLNGQGSEHAYLDLLRIVFQRFTDNDINFLMKKSILTLGDILDLYNENYLRPNYIDILKKYIISISKPVLLLKLIFLRRKMDDIFRLYKNFSDRKQFNIWRAKVSKIYNQIEKMINV